MVSALCEFLIVTQTGALQGFEPALTHCSNSCVLSLKVCWEWVEESKILASYS